MGGRSRPRSLRNKGGRAPDVGILQWTHGVTFRRPEIGISEALQQKAWQVMSNLIGSGYAVGKTTNILALLTRFPTLRFLPETTDRPERGWEVEAGRRWGCTLAKCISPLRFTELLEQRRFLSAYSRGIPGTPRYKRAGVLIEDFVHALETVDGEAGQRILMSINFQAMRLLDRQIGLEAHGIPCIAVTTRKDSHTAMQELRGVPSTDSKNIGLLGVQLQPVRRGDYVNSLAWLENVFFPEAALIDDDLARLEYLVPLIASSYNWAPTQLELELSGMDASKTPIPRSREALLSQMLFGRLLSFEQSELDHLTD